MYPIIFISNLQHNKLVDDILCYSKEFKILSPNDFDMRNLFNKINTTENMKITEEKVINKIIKFSQKDIRRLIFILYDIYNSIDDDINYNNIESYINNTQKKYKDISLFEATKVLLDEYSDMNNIIKLNSLIDLLIY